MGHMEVVGIVWIVRFIGLFTTAATRRLVRAWGIGRFRRRFAAAALAIHAVLGVSMHLRHSGEQRDCQGERTEQAGEKEQAIFCIKITSLLIWDDFHRHRRVSNVGRLRASLSELA